MKRFVLEKLAGDEWMLTDMVVGIIITFTEHEFNETQKVDIIPQTSPDAQQIATSLRECADWMFLHHYSVALPTPKVELQVSEDNQHVYIIRHKFPRMRIDILDRDITGLQAGNTLQKIGAFVKNYFHDTNLRFDDVL